MKYHSIETGAGKPIWLINEKYLVVANDIKEAMEILHHFRHGYEYPIESAKRYKIYEIDYKEGDFDDEAVSEKA